IFEYSDYRAYLKDLYKNSNLSDKKVSFRYLSRITGFKSPSALKRVMDGKCNLSPESINRCAKAFRLTPSETQFFKNLVFFNQAETLAEKQKFAREILRSQAFRKTHPLEESHYRYYTHWYYSVIRGMVGLPGFQDDPEWIARNLFPQVTTAE